MEWYLMVWSDNCGFYHVYHLECQDDCFTIIFFVQNGSRRVSTGMNPGTYTITHSVLRYDLFLLFQVCLDLSWFVEERLLFSSSDSQINYSMKIWEAWNKKAKKIYLHCTLMLLNLGINNPVRMMLLYVRLVTQWYHLLLICFCAVSGPWRIWKVFLKSQGSRGPSLWLFCRWYHICNI